MVYTTVVHAFVFNINNALDLIPDLISYIYLYVHILLSFSHNLNLISQPNACDERARWCKFLHLLYMPITRGNLCFDLKQHWTKSYMYIYGNGTTKNGLIHVFLECAYLKKMLPMMLLLLPKMLHRDSRASCSADKSHSCTVSRTCRLRLSQCCPDKHTVLSEKDRRVTVASLLCWCLVCHNKTRYFNWRSV